MPELNNQIKDILIRTVFRAASPVNRVIRKHDDRVLLYSNAGFRDNVRAVYDYMIREGYNRKYEICISADSLIPEELPENTEAVSCMKGILKYLRWTGFLSMKKASFQILQKQSDSQRLSAEKQRDAHFPPHSRRRFVS